MSTNLTVGWIGLGAMGAPMTRVLSKAGHRLLAYDLSKQACDAVADTAEIMPSAKATAGEADVVVVMVATADQLDSVLFGADGIADSLTPQTTVLIMSTVGVEPVQQAAAALAPYTSHVVDAPVSGGAARAAKGDLLIMVGGPDEDVATVRPLLDAMAREYPLVGSRVGDGQKLKIVNQLLCGVHIAAAGEALALADSMGLDVEQCHRVLNGGAAHSFMFQDRGGRMVAEDYEAVTSALDIFVKDMGLVTAAARQAVQPVPLASAAEQLYLRGRREGLGRLDDSVVYQMMRER